MNKIFWMVYGDGQGAPTAQHVTRASADKEAQRLARAHPGIKFYVLVTCAVAERNDVTFTKFTDADVLEAEIPF